MNTFTEKEIAEAAYYIWKNNGCPANTQAQDWEAAIKLLSSRNTKKTEEVVLEQTNALKRYAQAKAKKITPVSKNSINKALELAYKTNMAMQDTGTIPLKSITSLYKQIKL